MVQRSNRYAARCSQKELTDKQEETSGGQLVEALQLLRTVEDDSSSRGARCSSTSLQGRGTNSGGLNGGFGAGTLDTRSGGRLGNKGATSAPVRVGREGNGNRDTGRGGSLGVCDCVCQGDGEIKAIRGGLLGVARRSAGARDGLGLGVSLGTGWNSNTGRIDAEGNPGTRCRAWSRARNSLGLGLSLGGRSRGRSSAGWNDLNSRGLRRTTRLGLRLGLGGDNLRSASGGNRDSDAGHLSWGRRDLGGLTGLDRESDAGHLSWGGRDLGSLGGLVITNSESDLSDLGTIVNGCIDIRTGT